jgi:hypothetical protein
MAWRPGLMVDVLEAAEKFGASGLQETLALLLHRSPPDDCDFRDELLVTGSD